jgi:bacteriorhodopsin
LPQISDLFVLPLSKEALMQFHLFQAILLDLEPTAGTNIWTVMGNMMTTKVSSVYSTVMDSGGTIPALKWLWQGCCQQIHKVFFWLLVYNILNTRAMLQRNNFFMDTYTCIMCAGN